MFKKNFLSTTKFRGRIKNVCGNCSRIPPLCLLAWAEPSPESLPLGPSCVCSGINTDGVSRLGLGLETRLKIHFCESRSHFLGKGSYVSACRAALTLSAKGEAHCELNGQRHNIPDSGNTIGSFPWPNSVRGSKTKGLGLGLEGFRSCLGLEGFRSHDFEYCKEMVY